MFLSTRPVYNDDRGIALIAPVDVNLIIRRHLKYNFVKNLSMDYQCLISPSLFSVLLFCFVCLPAVSCPTITLSIDYQCLISPSLFSVLLFWFLCLEIKH
jgi:hypothetical protein